MPVDVSLNLSAGDVVTVSENAGVLTVETGAGVIHQSPIADVNSLTILGTLLGNESVSISADAVPTNGFVFDGAVGGNDTLSISGSAQSVDFVYDTLTDGVIDFFDGAKSRQVQYFGLDPIVSTVVASDVSLSFSGVSETINIDFAGPGATTVNSSAGEITTFTNPTSSLSIDLGGGDDTVNVNSLGAGFAADFTIEGGLGSDQINLFGLDIGSNDFSAIAEGIDLENALTADSIVLDGAISLTGNTTVNSDQFVASGSIDSPMTAYGLTINTIAGGSKTFGGSIGATDPLASLTTNSNGMTFINAVEINTTGEQLFGDDVLVGVNATLTGSNVDFQGTVNSNGPSGSVTVDFGSGVYDNRAPIGTGTDRYVEDGFVFQTVNPLNHLESNVFNATLKWENAAPNIPPNVIEVFRQDSLPFSLSSFLVLTTGSQPFPITLTASNGAVFTVTAGGTVLPPATFSGISSFTMQAPVGNFNFAVLDNFVLQNVGAVNLSVNSSGNGSTNFGSTVGTMVAFNDLATNADGTTRLAGDVSATSVEFLDAVEIAADLEITGTNSVRIASSIDAVGLNAALEVSTSSGGTKSFEGAIGSSTQLKSLTTSADGTTSLDAGSVAVTNDLTFNDNVTLQSNVVLNFNGTAILADGLDGTGSVTTTASGTLELPVSNNYSGNTVIQQGTLSVDGVLADANNDVMLGAGAKLVGTGVIAGNVSSVGATIAPGTSAGIISTGSLSLDAASTLEIEIDGLAAGTGFDQIAVTGTVNLGNATLLATSSVTPGTSTSFTIIDNDGVDPVVGMFNGLGDGSQLSIGGDAYRIFYAAGDGNDVVLIRDVASLSTVYVDDDWATGVLPGQDPDGAGPAAVFGIDSFATIQEGINVVTSGGTVSIADGAYVENLSMDQSGTLIGSGTDGPNIVAANAADSVLEILMSATDVALTNLNLAGGCDGVLSANTGVLSIDSVESSNNSCDGLNVSNASSIDITRSSFNDNGGDGVELNDVGAITFDLVTATGNDPGLLVNGAATFSDTDGVYANNADGGIVLIDLAGDVLLTRTRMDDNDLDLNGTGNGLHAIDGADPDTLAIGGNLRLEGIIARDAVGAGTQIVGVLAEGIGGDLTIVDSTGPTQSTVVSNHQSTGIWIDQVFGTSTVANAEFSNNGGTGLSIQNLAAFEGTNIIASSNGDHGILLATANGNIGVSSGQFLNNTSFGLMTIDSADVNVSGSIINGNQIGLSILNAQEVATNAVDSQSNGIGMQARRIGSLTDTDSSFSSNDDRGLAVIDVLGDVELTRTQLDNNDANTDANGVGFVATASSEPVAIGGNLMLHGVRARSSGGTQQQGVAVESVTGNVDFSDSTGTIQSTIVSNNLGDGIALGTVGGDVSLLNVSANVNGGLGLSVDKATNIGLTNSTFIGNASQGAVVNALGTVSPNGSAFNFNGTDGLEVSSAGAVLINGARFDNNGDDGLDAINVVGSVEVLNSDGENNSDQGINGLNNGLTEIAGGTWSGIMTRSTDSVNFTGSTIVSTKAIDVEAENAILVNTDIDVQGNTFRARANRDAAGAEGFSQAAGTSLSTANDSPLAVRISVNTIFGGTGNAAIGTINAGSTPGPAGGRVTVNSIAGAVVDSNGAANNVTAGNAIFLGRGVGTSTNAIETAVDRLEGAAGPVGFFVDDAGTLAIGGVSFLVVGVAGADTVSVTSIGPMTITEPVNAFGDVFLKAQESGAAGDDLILQNGINVVSVFGDVSLEAGDDITIPDLSSVLAINGSVLIKGDCNSTDPDGTTIVIDGVISSANGARVEGNADDDSITVRRMGLGGVVLGGLGGDDDYLIEYSPTTTFGSEIQIDDSAGGVDHVTARGTAGDDELFLTTENPPTAATTDRLSRGTTSSEIVTLFSNLEALVIELGDGLDALHAQPSMAFPVFADGGSPSFGGPGVPAGDVLDFDPLGNTFTIDNKTILTDGGTPDPFQPIEFVDFESLPLTPIGTSSTMRFDFDHTNTASSVGQSPTQAGRIGVRPDTLHSDGLGYGWQAGVDSFERDDGFYVGPFADLLRDGHALNQPATFTVDVDNGWYLVSGMFGSPYTSVGDVSVVNADTGDVVASGIFTETAISTHVEMLVLVTDGTLDLEFINSTIHPPIFSIQGLTIQPAVLLSMGLDTSAIGTPEADGVSIDNAVLHNAEPNSWVTVETTHGDIINVDADPDIAGIQVPTDSNGEAVIIIRRPDRAVTAIVSFVDVEGAKTGCTAITYTIPTSRAFDFNHTNTNSAFGQSPTQEPVAIPGMPNGFLGVPKNRLLTVDNGYGWLSEPRGFDNGALADPLGDLKRDGAVDNVVRTFAFDVPNGQYQFTATVGYDRDIDGMEIDANGTVFFDISVNAEENAQVIGEFTVTSGQAVFTFSDQSGVAPNWAINGLQVRQVANVNALGLGPNLGSVPADGLSLSFINGTTTLDDGDQITIATTAGTIITPDINPMIDGIQVEANDGAFEFTIVAPTEAAIPTVSAASLDNEHFVSITDPAFLSYAISGGRRFDFNHTHSASNSGPSPTTPGFVGVLRTDVDPVADGFGWVVSPNSRDSHVPNEFDDENGDEYIVATTDLYRDGHLGHTSLGSRTFKVQVNSALDYNVQVHTGSQEKDQGVRVFVEGVAIPQEVDTVAQTFASLILANASDQNLDGFLEITFESTGNISPFWIVNGVDVVDTSLPLPPAAALAAEETRESVGIEVLTPTELQPYVDVAIQAWKDTGLTAAQEAIIDNVEFVITDLDSIRALAMTTTTDRVVIDDDGSGIGWNPLLDVSVADRYDLLTVIAHEIGHLLGKPDTSSLTQSGDVMNSILEIGERNDSYNGNDNFFANALATLLPF